MPRIPIAGSAYWDGDISFIDLAHGPKGVTGQLVTMVTSLARPISLSACSAARGAHHLAPTREELAYHGRHRAMKLEAATHGHSRAALIRNS